MPVTISSGTRMEARRQRVEVQQLEAEEVEVA